MGSPYPSTYIIEPGADTALNASRRFTPVAFAIHRPQSRCPGVVGVGRTRHHSTPGTFNQVSCADGRGHGIYPFDCRCTHAAGANHVAAGNEADGFQGERCGDPLLRSLGESFVHANREWGIPLKKYPDGAPRVWLDRTGRVDGCGFYNHSSIDYPPDRSLNHHDGITDAEFARSLQLVGAAPIMEIPDMLTFTGKDGPLKGKHFSYGPRGIERELSPEETWISATVLKVPHFDLAQSEYQVLAAAPTGGGAPAAVTVVLEGAISGKLTG